MKSGGDGGRRRRRRVTRSQPMSEINVTPFVDVMLVLLIIFMVAAPLMTVGIEVKMPETTADALPSDSEVPLEVKIDANGLLYLQDESIDETLLIERLRSLADERESDRIYLRVDRANEWSRVAQVMAELSSEGFSNIALVTDAGGSGLDGSDG